MSATIYRASCVSRSSSPKSGLRRPDPLVNPDTIQRQLNRILGSRSLANDLQDARGSQLEGYTVGSNPCPRTAAACTKTTLAVSSRRSSIGSPLQQPLRRVLDAGCGFSLPLDFPPTVELVGLDASAEALAKNENIDEAIVGDIETHEFDAGSFDAVLCWTVLEHLERPELALRKFSRTLRPGGLLIIGVPNIWSIKGVITKTTPHSFHVWVYRHLLGHRDAGRPGSGPYRTYLKLAVSPGRLTRLAHANDLELVYAKSYGSPPEQLPVMMRRAWNGVAAVLKLALLGKVDPNASEYAVVFRKTGQV